MDEQVPMTLDDMIVEKQISWNKIVKMMNEKLASMQDIIDLENIIYGYRQDAVDYYFTVISQIAKLNKTFKTEYAVKYKWYKEEKQYKYTDAAINSMIDAELCDEKYRLQTLDSHSKYMLETIKTIDDIIFATKDRIRLEEYIQGPKR